MTEKEALVATTTTIILAAATLKAVNQFREEKILTTEQGVRFLSDLRDNIVTLTAKPPASTSKEDPAVTRAFLGDEGGGP